MPSPQHRTLLITCVLLLAALGAKLPLAAQPVRQLVSTLQHDLSTVQSSVLDFWLCHGLDRRFGGVHGTLSLNGTPSTPDTKGLVQQTRHAWTFSLLHDAGFRVVAKTSNITSQACISSNSSSPTTSSNRSSISGAWPSSKEVADSSYKFFNKNMRRADGLYVWNVSRDGRTVIQDTIVQYGQWHAIMAHAMYGEAFNNTQALKEGLQTFRAADKLWHNSSTGGYNEFGNNTFPADIGAPGVKILNPWRWQNVTGPIPSTLNNMMHGMEAFLALHNATKDPLVLNRTVELVDIMCNRLVRFDGMILRDYYPAGRATGPKRPSRRSLWQPSAETMVNFGHVTEITWMLLDALEYLSSINAIPPAEADQCRNSTLAMGVSAVQHGYDKTHGGFFESALPLGNRLHLNSTVKVWWTQAESMLALWPLYEATRDSRYIQMLLETANFITKHMLNPMTGEFHWQVAANGTFVPSRDLDIGTMGNRWKASYHSVRLWLYLDRWIQASQVV